MKNKPVSTGPTEARRKAISYIRFSSLAQGNDGRDSTARQKDALTAALAKWNLELDATFTDAGKSGYHQKHTAKGGAMFALRSLALSGELRDKVLIVEDFDRAGRMQVTDAAPLLLDMLNNGVDMVVGAYGGEYFSRDTVNANPFTFYRALDEMNRGYGESKRKSEMLTHKWAARREAVKAHKFVPLAGLPAWLENGHNEYLVKPEVVRTIKKVFSLYLNGFGCQSIAGKLNNDKTPMPTAKRKNATGWNPTFIQRLIKNKALIGYYSPRVNPQLEQAGVFPVVIDEATFYAANAKLTERTHANGHMGGNHSKDNSLFGGLVKCSKCGGGLIRHLAHGHVYLICSNSRKGKCSSRGVRFDIFEHAFLHFLTHDMIKPLVPESPDATHLDTIKGKLAEVERQIVKYQGLIDQQDNPSVTLANALTRFEGEKLRLQKELETEAIKAKGSPTIDKAYFETMQKLVTGKLNDAQSKMKLREAIRGATESLIIDIPSQTVTAKFRNVAEAHTLTLQKDGYTVHNVEGEGTATVSLAELTAKVGDGNISVPVSREWAESVGLKTSK